MLLLNLIDEGEKACTHESWRPIFQIVQKRAVQKIQINAKQIQINAKQIQINTKNFSKIQNSQN